MDIERVKHQLKLPPLWNYDLIWLALSDATYLNQTYIKDPKEKARLILQHHRLAHLGDYIMNAAVGDYLFQKFPEANQGNLSQRSQPLKMRKGAVLYALQLGLNEESMCNLGDGIGERDRKGDLYGEIFEALVGAIYLESGRDFSIARDWFQSQCSIVIEQQLAKNI